MSVDYKDYYATLGVSRTASAEEIKKSFRKLAREHHPDVAKNKKAAEEKFKEINEAYEVLSDPEKRKKYERFGASWKQGAEDFETPPGREARGGRTADRERAQEFHFGGTGFSDFFEQLFGRRGRSGFDFGGNGHDTDDFQQVRGQDIEGDILVTLDEVMNGSIRDISLQRVNPKTGRAETSNFKVRIPRGVQDGQTIRVAGKGGEGAGGSGDLFLHVRYAAHPDFRARGGDLYYDLDLAPWEAALGTTVSVPSLDRQVTVRIPPGTNNGQKLRIRGRGLPKNTSGSEHGDLYVVVNVQVPGQLTEEERAAWEKLSQISRFNPRQASS
jgi:curved DNA-binding protein